MTIEWANILGTAIWAIANLLSYYGYGVQIADRVPWQQKLPVGLTIALGMTFCVAVGGLLNWLGFATYYGALAVLGVGWALALLSWQRSKNTCPSKTAFCCVSFWWRSALVLAFSICLIRFLLAITLVDSNLVDDPIYLSFVSEQLASGFSMQPFSFRRMASYGGHHWLQSLLHTATSFTFANVFDRGICLLALLGAFAEQGFRSIRSATYAKQSAFAIVLVLMLFFVPMQNSVSEYSGALIAFLLFYWYDQVAISSRIDLRWHIVILSLVIACLSSFRANYVSMTLMALLFAFVLPDGVAWRKRLAIVGLILLGIGLFCISWMLDLWRSNATFFYPLMKGNAVLPLNGKTEVAIGSLLSDMVLRIWQLGLIEISVAVCILVNLDIAKRRKIVLLFSLCTVWISAICVLSLFFSADDVSIQRYLLSLILPFVLFSILVVIDEDKSVVGWRRGFVILCLIGTLCHGIPLYRQELERNARLLPAIEQIFMAHELEQKILLRYQLEIPEQASILSIIDKPHYLNFARNKIYLLDQVGMASPMIQGQHMVLDSFDAWMRYLSSANIDYILIQDERASRGLYNRDLMSQQAMFPNSPHYNYAIKTLDVLNFLQEKRSEAFFDRGEVYALKVPKFN